MLYKSYNVNYMVKLSSPIRKCNDFFFIVNLTEVLLQCEPGCGSLLSNKIDSFKGMQLYHKFIIS